MAQHSLFRYLYLKVWITLIRIFVDVTGNASNTRDLALIPRNSRQDKGIKIPSRDKGRHIKADIYYPSATPDTPLPVVVYWHGSGFVFSHFGVWTLFCSRIARHAGIAVVDVDYRKSPETPFPAPVDDAEDVLLWIASQGQRFDPKRVAVAGSSAGGNVALVAATKLRKKLAGAVSISAVVVMYPLTNLAALPETRKVPKPVNPTPPWLLNFCIDCYAPDGVLRTDPALSPHFADSADFPATVAIITAEGDDMRPEAQELAERLKRDNADGKKIIDFVCQGVGHGFDVNAAPGSVAYARREEMYDLVTDILKDALKV
ncbi:Alpha/Beta hydrolase protein [Xylaria arbuscula]|nr:Alpha/Beta hydrolase protein [Xylaria arbuscula]